MVQMVSRNVIGLALLVVRVIRRWTQDRAARAAGITPAKLSRYENGKETPDPTTAEAIAGAMGFSPDFWQIVLDLVELAPEVPSAARHCPPANADLRQGARAVSIQEKLWARLLVAGLLLRILDSHPV
jgi:transcriptional regulator with XRE-family HTH domain